MPQMQRTKSPLVARLAVVAGTSFSTGLFLAGMGWSGP